jgi:hypothetical protein
MSGHLTPRSKPQRIAQAVEEILGRLSQLGWLEELVKMKREHGDCLAPGAMGLLEMAFQRRTDGLPGSGGDERQ